MVQLDRYIADMKASEPELWLVASCYHMETRSSTQTLADGRVVTNYYTEKVHSHIQSKNFPVREWVDVSIIPRRPNFSLIKLTSTKRNSWADTESENRYNEFDRAFRERHAFCDVYRDISFDMRMDGFKSSAIAYDNVSSIPFCLNIVYNKYFYIIVTLLGGSWLYRAWLTCMTESHHVTFVKRCKC